MMDSINALWGGGYNMGFPNVSFRQVLGTHMNLTLAA